MPHPGLVDVADAVLVVIDIQERLAAVMERRDEVVASASRLVRTAAALGIPVIVTRQYPEGLGDTVPELASALQEAGARVVDKTAFCSSCEEAFAGALDELDRGQVLLAGMETHICVAQTALALEHEGFRVQVAADACCSRRAGDNDTALDRLRQAGVIVTTSEAIMYEAVGRAGTDAFKAVLRIVKEG